MTIKREQTICEVVGVDPKKPEAASKLGLALKTIGTLPINGLRHREENGTNGWYLWCGGEIPNEDDFFSALHVEHISEYLPEVLDYLDLPPGYRFQIDGKDYEDVWFDRELLNA